MSEIGGEKATRPTRPRTTFASLPPLVSSLHSRSSHSKFSSVTRGIRSSHGDIALTPSRHSVALNPSRVRIDVTGLDLRMLDQSKVDAVDDGGCDPSGDEPLAVSGWTGSPGDHPAEKYCAETAPKQPRMPSSGESFMAGSWSCRGCVIWITYTTKLVFANDTLDFHPTTTERSRDAVLLTRLRRTTDVLDWGSSFNNEDASKGAMARVVDLLLAAISLRCS